MVLKTYSQLEQEFDKKIVELQKKCPHIRTKWFVEWWGIGHSTGKETKRCLRCNKCLDRRPINRKVD